MSDLADDDIILLAQEGFPPRKIADRTGADIDHIHYRLRLARESGIEIPSFRAPTAKEVTPVKDNTVVVPARMLTLLEADADRRGVSIQDAARRILENGLLQGATHA